MAYDSDVVYSSEQLIEKLIQPSFSQEFITTASLDIIMSLHFQMIWHLNVIKYSLFSIWWALPFHQATVLIECDVYFPMEAFIIYLTEHIVLYGLNILFLCY